MAKAKWIVPGTEGTGDYVAVLRTEHGIVAVREFNPGDFRVRVEPTESGKAVLAAKLTREAGWDKQPGDSGQNRFSTVVRGVTNDGKSEALVAKVKAAVHALLSHGAEPETNSKARAWQKRLANHDTLVAELKARKVPGFGLAGVWPAKVVRAKVAG